MPGGCLHCPFSQIIQTSTLPFLVCVFPIKKQNLVITLSSVICSRGLEQSLQPASAWKGRYFERSLWASQDLVVREDSVEGIQERIFRSMHCMEPLSLSRS